jgi:hypothetical protein
MKGFSFKKQHACFKTLYAFWSSLCLPRNRRAREASILQSIENGAQTLFDIVSKTYSDVDRKLWIPASFNVRLHVDHLSSLHKLPKVSTRNIIIMRYTFPLYALFKKIKKNRPTGVRQPPSIVLKRRPSHTGQGNLESLPHPYTAASKPHVRTTATGAEP